jgi:DNA repair protein RadC
MAFKDLPAHARPRERLLTHGAGALGDAELLALLLRSGTAQMDVLALAQHLLMHFGGIAGLVNAPEAALGQIKGLGPAKRAELLAVLEIARRSFAAQARERPLLNEPAVLADLLRSHLSGLEHEQVLVIFLDTQLRLLRLEPMFRGGLSSSEVHPREVVKRALALNAAAVVLAHNHPSGLATPSLADERLTQQMKQALALVDVRLLDHFIVAGSEVASLAQRGLL